MNYRRKTTAGLSGALWSVETRPLSLSQLLLPFADYCPCTDSVCWALSGICLGIYAIIENISIPISEFFLVLKRSRRFYQLLI